MKHIKTYPQLEYYHKNKQFLSQKSLANYYKNRKEILKKQRIYKLKNKARFKERDLKSNKKYYINNRTKILTKSRNQIFKEYGITENVYNELLKEQHKKCAICFKENINKNLSIDHCHKTGKIRGLLCNNCNLALGLLNDNTELLQNAINYLNTKNKSCILQDSTFTL